MSLPLSNQPFHFVANVVVCMSYLSSARHFAQVCCFFALVRELQTLGAVTVRSVPSIPYRTSRQEKRINKISIFFRMRKDIAFAPSVRHLFLFNFLHE